MSPLYLLLPLFFYLIGSIPFALITGKLVKGIDIREEGSGNAGAGNSFRILGALPGTAVLALDFLKGFLPVFLLRPHMTELFAVFCIICLVAGHVFPIFASFRGGKGVSSSAGALTALVPPAAPICLLVFGVILLRSSYLSLASMSAAWSLPLAYFMTSLAGWTDFSKVYLVFFLVTAALITLLHRKNISRLIRGDERKTVIFSRNRH